MLANGDHGRDAEFVQPGEGRRVRPLKRSLPEEGGYRRTDLSLRGRVSGRSCPRPEAKRSERVGVTRRERGLELLPEGVIVRPGIILNPGCEQDERRHPVWLIQRQPG